MPLNKKQQRDILEYHVSMKKRYVACFDFLGIKNMTNKDIEGVLSLYAETLREIDMETRTSKIVGLKHLISYVWFSDTFIIYTLSDSTESFYRLLMASKRFFVKAIYKQKAPLTGAISYGDFCSLKRHSLILGPALVDAHEYCEKQDWINFILTPKAEKRVSEFDFNNQQWFSRYDVPLKDKDYKHYTEKLIGFSYNQHVPNPHGGNLLNYLKKMAKDPKNSDYKHKYENTLEALKQPEPLS